LPLSSLKYLIKERYFLTGEGSFRREGAEPPLKFSPPLKQNKNQTLKINLFERGIKGVSLKTQTNRIKHKLV
jgi:hypothetical protein